MIELDNLKKLDNYCEKIQVVECRKVQVIFDITIKVLIEVYPDDDKIIFLPKL